MRVAAAAVALALLAAFYALAVERYGFGHIGPAINFARVALSVAAFLVLVPLIPEMFTGFPIRRRDYLLTGALLVWLSAVGFTVWNEVGRRIGTPTGALVSPISGFFGLMMALGGAFYLAWPIDGVARYRVLAALAAGIGLAALASFGG